MRLLTQKDGDISTHFDKVDETPEGSVNTSFKQLKTKNHTNNANGSKLNRHLPVGQFFGFCNPFKKITKNLGFELDLKTATEKKLVYTKKVEADINIKNENLFLTTPVVIPSLQTQIKLNEAFSKCFKLSFVAWTTVKKPVNTEKDYQLDIRST